jgi:hypothetical protein
MSKQLDIFLHQPRPFLQFRIQKAVPVLSALLGASKDFLTADILEKEFLSNHLPIEGVEIIDETACALFGGNDLPEQLALLLAPATVRKIGLLNAEPLKHAAISIYTRDKLCNILPILNFQIFL